MLNTDPQGFVYRVVAVVAGLATIGFGVSPLLRSNDLFGTNWFGELVFGPSRDSLGSDRHRLRLFQA